jgi:metallo-beta-lactamase class B
VPETIRRISIFLPFAFCALLIAQPTQPPLPLKSNTPAVKADVEKAKKIAGSEWATAAHYFCEAPHADADSDPVIEPTKIFDNVYAIGNAGTTVYVISTSDGLIMIDSARRRQLETQVLPGFQKLGLDPGKVKMILITHGHEDHWGGSPYFQEHHDSRVYMAKEDWDLIEHPPAGRGGSGRATAIPKHDGVIKEGEPLVLGDETVMPYAAGPHTPGSMGFIFPVKDNGTAHMAALFGSVLLVTTGTSDEGMQEHLKVVERFKEQAKKAKVDVELQNHPLMDDFTVKLAKLQIRKPGDPNPFVVGQASYLRFLDVMSECMQADIDRRANR